MKKYFASVSILLLLALALLLMPAPASAQENPCGSRGTRIAKNAASGAAMGALIGGVLGGGKGAAIGAGVGAGAGGFAGSRNQPGCQAAAQAKKGEPFPERVTPANQRTTMKEMPTVHIRRLQGGSQASLIGLLGPALDKNGYSLVDPNEYRRNRDVAEYLVDITVHQLQQQNGGSYTNIQGKNGSIAVSPSRGSAQFLVTIATYRFGRYDRNLSAVDLPVTVTHNGGNVQIMIHGRSAGFQTGSYDMTYTVDPHTAAAYQAIVKIFNLP